MSNLPDTIRTLRLQSRVLPYEGLSQKRREIKNLQVPRRAFRALTIALAGRLPVYFYTADLGSPKILRYCAELLPPLTRAQSEEDLAIQEITEAGEKGLIYRRMYPPLRVFQRRDWHYEEGAEQILFAPAPAYRAPLVVEAHHGILHVRAWDEIPPRVRARLFEVWGHQEIMMGKDAVGAPLYYPAKFDLIASGAEPIPPSLQSFPLVCPWDDADKFYVPVSSDELAVQIERVRTLLEGQAQFGTPLFDLNPEALALLDGCSADKLLVARVAQVIALLDNPQLSAPLPLGMMIIPAAAVQEAMDFCRVA